MTFKYNDSDIINNRDSKIANAEYQQTTQNSTADLIELYEKMVAERQYIANNNPNHSLDNILEATDRHISILRSILPNNCIRTTANIEPISMPHLRPFINNGDTPPNIIQLPNSNNNVPNIDDNNPTPPLSPDTRPNTNRPINNGNTPQLDTAPRTQTRRNNRNSPLQSGIISNIVKSIFGRKIRTLNIADDEHKNRFHNIVVQNSNCDPCRKMVTNECNILRLILLYIALYPHCRHTHILSTIAEERVQILSEIA